MLVVLEVDRHLADRLHGVGVEHGAGAVAISAISSTGKIVPVSLLAHITETIAVFVGQQLAIFVEVEPALGVDVQPMDDVALVASCFSR